MIVGSLPVLLPPAAAADPGHPGTPHDPTVLFHEDFENGLGSGDLVLLAQETDDIPRYVSADGGLYTAEGQWAEPANCNGFVLDGHTDDADITAAGCTSGLGQLRTMATALGELNGTSPPEDNHVVAAYTDGDPGANQVEFATQAPLALEVENRFITFSVSAAAVNCWASPPLLHFFLDDGVDEIPATDTAINPCSAPGGVGDFASDRAVLFTGDALGIVMRNENGSGVGNDHAFDDIRILDATPQLDKEFTPAEVTLLGGTSTLVFTITNTSELAAKEGWSFTDALADGLVVADPAGVATTCANAVVDAEAGGTTIAVSGDLEAGEVSCTVSVDVAQTSPGDAVYENGPGDLSDVVGLELPGVAEVTFSPPPSFTSCDARGFLGIAPTAPDASEWHAVDLVTGDLSLLRAGLGEDDDIQINALGYSTVDDRIYGIEIDRDTSETTGFVVVVGADDVGQRLGPVTGLAGRPFHATGDVSPDGRLYATAGTTVTVIDVDPDSPGFLTIEREFERQDPDGIGLAVGADWVFRPSDGLIYSLRGGGEVVSVDPATGVMALVSQVDPAPSGSGAQFLDAAGFLYAYENATGDIHRIDIDTGDAEVFASGPAIARIDGARCPNAPIDLDFGDAPASYGTLLADDGPRHALAGYDPVAFTSTLMLGTQVGADLDGQPSDAADLDTFDDAVVGDRIEFVPGLPTTVELEVTNLTGEVATLAGWMDLDGSGSFDPDERVVLPVAPDATSIELTFDPVTTTEEFTYARFRLFPGELDDPSPLGPAAAGEVEDHLVTLLEPELELVKTSDASDDVAVGDEVTFTFEITNTGGVPVSDVTVDDPLPGLSALDCDPTQPATLAPGEQMTCAATYTVTQDDVDAGELVNTATVCGVPEGVDPGDPDAPSVCAEGGSVVPFEQDPALSLDKTAQVEDRDDLTAEVGDSVLYLFTVTNTGNVTMSDVAVDDPLEGLSPVECPGDTLAPAEAMTCTATYTVTEEDAEVGSIVNVATASGVPPLGSPDAPVDSAPASVEVDVAPIATEPGAVASPPPPMPLPRTGAGALLLLLTGAGLLGSGGRLVRAGRSGGPAGGGPAGPAGGPAGPAGGPRRGPDGGLRPAGPGPRPAPGAAPGSGPSPASPASRASPQPGAVASGRVTVAPATPP